MTGWTAPLLIASSVVALAAGYADTLLSFHDRWGSTTQGYSHGYLLVAISVWLVWRRRDAFTAPDARPQWAWLLPLAGLAALWVAGYAMQVRIVQQVAVPGLLWLWIATAFGWTCARRHLFALVVLYLAVPIWDLLVLPLREIAVWVTEGVLALLNVPAYIDGFRIYVPAGAFEVAGGCSGLNYLLVSLTLGLLYAHLYLRGPWLRGAAVAIAVAVALLSNWVRVVALVLIGYYTEMRSEIVDDHEMFGWIVFGGFMVPYLYFLGRVESRGEEPRSESVARDPRAIWRCAAAAWVAAAVALGGPLLRASVDWRGGAPLEVAAPAPAQALSEPPPWQPDYHGYDRALHFEVPGTTGTMLLSVYTWAEQRQGKEMIYYRNRIAAEIQRQGPVERQPAGELQVNQLQVRQGRDRRLVWWYYRTGGYPSADERLAKLLQLVGLVNGDGSARLVVLSAECGRDDCSRAQARLHSAGSEYLAALERAFKAGASGPAQ